jgi:hypothetical protein
MRNLVGEVFASLPGNFENSFLNVVFDLLDHLLGLHPPTAERRKYSMDLPGTRDAGNWMAAHIQGVGDVFLNAAAQILFDDLMVSSGCAPFCFRRVRLGEGSQRAVE